MEQHIKSFGNFVEAWPYCEGNNIAEVWVGRGKSCKCNTAECVRGNSLSRAWMCDLDVIRLRFSCQKSTCDNKILQKYIMCDMFNSSIVFWSMKTVRYRNNHSNFGDTFSVVSPISSIFVIWRHFLSTELFEHGGLVECEKKPGFCSLNFSQ